MLNTVVNSVEKCAVRLKVVKKYHSVNTVFKLQLATGSQTVKSRLLVLP